MEKCLGMTDNLTVVILTYNEQLNLPHTLRSIRDWVGRIVVVDSLSTDGTRRIAESFNCDIIDHRFVNMGTQRKYALSASEITTEWVLFLDADECITEDLRHEIEDTLRNAPVENGF